MILGIRSKLLLVSLLLIALGGAAFAAILESQLRSWTEQRIEGELEAQALSAVIAIEAQTSTLSVVAPALAEKLAEAGKARITIIDDRGVVIGDSQISPSDLGKVENHADRPEIIQARSKGRGSSRRHSYTVDQDMLYVAERFEGGFVRVATPLAEVSEVISRLRIMLVLSGLLGLVIAVFMSGLASRLSVGARRSLEVVLESLNEAVIAVDQEQSITLVNRAAFEMLGIPEKSIGKSLAEVVTHPDLLQLAHRAASGLPAAADFEVSEPSKRWFLARANPEREGAGTVIVVHDVTEIRRLEAIRRDFVANVSHELRTPVSIIRANAETLLEGALDDKNKAGEFSAAILRHADRLSRLIADLLDLSRIEAGRYPIELEAVAVGPALKRIVELFEQAAKEKNITLTANASLQLAATADARALEQVLSNLVDNAVKYTPHGGRVELRASLVDQTVRIEVADDGNGIEPRHRERIFQRFYRVDKGRARDVGGTGLGLAIVKHLTDAMDGFVGVEPNTPRGTTFWVTLPAAHYDQISNRPRPADEARA